MNLLILVLALLVLPFGLVLFFGAPYLPTMKPTSKTAIKLLGLKKGDLLVDLGCGDGALMVEAAKLGIESIGYEMNPLVFAIGWLRTRKYRKFITIKLGNFWKHNLPPETTAVFTFLHTRFMKRLDLYLINQAQKIEKPFILASYTFKIPGKEVTNQVDGVFLYSY